MNVSHLCGVSLLLVSLLSTFQLAAEPPTKESGRAVGFEFSGRKANSPRGDDSAPSHVFVHHYPMPESGFVTGVRLRNDVDGGETEISERFDLLILRPMKDGWDVVHRVELSDDLPKRVDGDTVLRLPIPLAVEPGYVFGHWQAAPRGAIPFNLAPRHVQGRSVGKVGFDAQDVAVGRFIPSAGFSGRRDYFLQVILQPAGADVQAADAPTTGPHSAPQAARKSQPDAPSHKPVLEITSDIVLDERHKNHRLVIKESNVTIDGRGLWVTGSHSGKPNQLTGVGISADGVSNVTLKNVNAKGWETGLAVSNGRNWTIVDCNFSDNFHDPNFGWGENGRRGGIVLNNVSGCTLRRCRANRVWDGCVLVGSDNNRIEDCNFSHTSNTCLKMWRSSNNLIKNNDLSYGLRIKPGEVHARDSTCVLIETASNDNRFEDNDCTHGGDGVFIRVLNGVVSTGNYFLRNDCSYANNNCFEAWSPRNTYVDNKANHGSYGFWLGASDQTVLLNNEASYNGLPDGFHNSPHLPGGRHAGIVFMFGPSSHTIARGNRCVGNHGAGIALIGDQGSQGRKWKAFHWIIEDNSLSKNTWGVFAQHADWIDMCGNAMKENELGDVFEAGNVTNLERHEKDAAIKSPPTAVLRGPEVATVGKSVTFDASASKDPASRNLAIRWDLGDGTTSRERRVEHAFSKPGFYRVGLTVNNGSLSDLAWRDLYVVDNESWTATEGEARRWTWIDPKSRVAFSDDVNIRLAGKTSLSARVAPYSGNRFELLYPSSRNAALSLADHSHFATWIRTENENIPAWQDINPVITLYQSKDRWLRFTPAQDRLAHRANNEEREGWTLIRVPLSGDPQWKRDGQPIEVCNWLTIGIDSWGAEPLRIWLDGMALQP